MKLAILVLAALAVVGILTYSGKRAPRWERDPEWNEIDEAMGR